MLADGMGGHAAGEVASRMAVDSVNEVYFQERKGVERALSKAFQTANQRIFDLAKTEKDKAGMGTTCSALVLHQGAAHFAQIGDSRIYVYRDQNLQQLTTDQTVVQQMYQRGEIQQHELEIHSDKNILLQAMGTKTSLEVAGLDQPMAITNGDIFLLCSDGLTDLVSDLEIKQTLEMNSLAMISQCLVALAKDRGGHDNITVLLVRVEERNQMDTTRETRDIS